MKAFKLCILAASLSPWTLSEEPNQFLQEAVPACGHEEECDVSAKFKRSLAAAAGLCEALRGTLTSTLEVSAASSMSRHVHYVTHAAGYHIADTHFQFAVCSLDIDITDALSSASLSRASPSGRLLMV